MNKQQALIPEFRFPEFEKDGEWNEKRFEDLFEIGNGRDYKHLDEGDIPVYGSGGYMLSVNDFLYDGESVCIGRKGTIDNPFFLKGKFWTVDTLFYTYAFNDCLPKYIYYIFQNINWTRHNEAGGVPSLSKKNIYKIETSTPPKIQEQQKIASCLSSLDDLISAHNEKLDALKDHKKGLLQNLFPQEGENVPKYRFPEFEGNGEWVEKKLGELLEFKNGVNASKEQYGKGVKFINVLDILKDQPITYESVIGSVDIDDITLKKNSVTFGDILFQRSSETQEDVGTANVYLDEEKVCTFGGFVIRGKKIGSYNPKFLNDLLKTRTIRESISTKAGGSTRFNVGQEVLAATEISLPSLKEQQKIATCLSEVGALIAAETEKIEELQQHKHGLMQGLFPKVEG